MNIDHAQTALKKYFGYDAFRPLQAEAITALYDKKDVLLLMPTGGGKSVCFQIPAITTDGPCIVVSPLISLMKDQVEALRANGVNAALLNSSIPYQEQRKVEDDLYHGRLDLLYTSPEKMANQEFFPLLKASKIGLFAIDEAHCISSWGHDFRPEYRQLRFLKNAFPDVPIIALTATADRLTRADIVEQLHLRSPEIFIASFDRPNLNLEVRPGRKRMEQMLDFLKQRPNQSGIVYCLSKKTTEMVAEKLQGEGYKADFYHAGMESQRRSKVQEDFINDRSPIICATVAFGMGIDKSNVRWVIHYNLPKNIESYYQEIGRAGRDGAKSDTLLFSSGGDLVTLREMIGGNDGEFREIHLAKLERMYQYATSLICRRKILLNYFNETTVGNCGNCDICKNPPKEIDGTIIAQKALSAIARTKEQVAGGVLVDILRGSKGYNLVRAGWDKIKTHGAGKDIRQQDWFFYVEQMVNQGLCEVAFEDHNKLRLTPSGKAVLFDGQQVQFVQADTVLKRREQEDAAIEAKDKSRKASERLRVRDDLFEHLRLVRLDIARQKSVPPYIIFADTSLEEMAAERPLSEADFAKISGVGQAKMQEYGKLFLGAIRDFLKEKGVLMNEVSEHSTYAETYRLYLEGLSIEEIAQRRSLSNGTVQQHFLYLYNEGENVDLLSLVGQSDYEKIVAVLPEFPPPLKLKEVFERLNQEVPYIKIHFAIAIQNRETQLKNAGKNLEPA